MNQLSTTFEIINIGYDYQYETKISDTFSGLFKRWR